MTNTLTLWSME